MAQPETRIQPVLTSLTFYRDFDFAYGVPQQVVPGVHRVVAENPKDYTWTGTNTHVIGTRDVAILDPGPAMAEHVDAVMAAVGQRPVRAILVTHPHRDHSGAAALFAARTGAPVYGRNTLTPNMAAQTDEDVDVAFTPTCVLDHGDIVAGDDWRLEAIHTPGHFPDHLCFALAGSDILFSGDHVMGWSTTVISPPLGHLSDYLASLEHLLGRPEGRYLPGHGPTIDDPAAFLRGLIAHRQERTRQVALCLDRGIEDAEAIVAEIYTALSPRLRRAAAQSVRAHLDYLRARRTTNSTAAE